jgi:hypothetical protein
MGRDFVDPDGLRCCREMHADKDHVLWRVHVAFRFRHVWPDRAEIHRDIRNLIAAYRSMS